MHILAHIMLENFLLSSKLYLFQFHRLFEKKLKSKERELKKDIVTYTALHPRQFQLSSSNNMMTGLSLQTLVAMLPQAVSFRTLIYRHLLQHCQCCKFQNSLHKNFLQHCRCCLVSGLYHFDVSIHRPLFQHYESVLSVSGPCSQTLAATLQISTVSFRTLFTNSCCNTKNQHHQFQVSIRKHLLQHYKSAPSDLGLYSQTLVATLQISTTSFRALFTNACCDTTNQHHQI